MAFKYKKRSAASWDKRSSQQGGDYEGFILDDYKVWKPRKGDNTIRILPPSWDESKDYGFEVQEHYGLDVHVHYNLGPDGGTALCISKMRHQDCPICEARAKAERAGNEELSKSLKPGKRVLVWLIDCNDEDKGPQLWAMPWTLDREICKISKDKRTGEIFAIDDPKNGYDVSFEVEGDGVKRKYEGVQTARKPSSVDPAFLDYIEEHPLTDVLLWRDFEELESLFAGTVPRKQDEDGKGRGKRSGAEDDERSSKRRAAPGKEDEDEPAPRRRRASEDEDEEEAPPPRRRKTPPPDEDEEEPTLRRRKAPPTEDEEEESTPRRRKAPPPDEDEEEEPAPRRRKTPPPDEDEEEPTLRRRKAPPPEDDDEDEEEVVDPKKRAAQLKEKFQRTKR